MGAPSPGMTAADETAAAILLDALKTIDVADRKEHEAVLNYWLSIRGTRELPPLRDLDPLEISDAAPNSILMELIGGGEDAEIRHCGENLRGGSEVARIGEAPRPSLLSSLARKLSIVAVSRNFLAFEDEFSADGQTTHCGVTLLPFSAAGAWVDYVYAFVSYETKAGESRAEPVADSEVEEAGAAPVEEVLELDEPVAVEVEANPEADPQPEDTAPAVPVETAATAPRTAGFTFDSKAAASGFYGTQAVKIEPVMPTVQPTPSRKSVEATEAPVTAPPEEPVAVEESPAPDEEFPAVDEEPAAEAIEDAEPVADVEPQAPTSALEGSLQSKLIEVRARADEARMAKLRANVALYEGLGAAYDFALDAEDRPEEYLKLVEAQGLKIQLRAPMRPVVKLAFDGLCDDSTIAQLEAVLAWAIEQELPRGTLAQRIEDAGGIGPILSGEVRAAA